MSSLPRCSHRWITLTMIAAMFVFAGHAFAAGKTMQNHVKRSAVDAEGNPLPNPQNDNTSAPSSVLAAPPANDTCAGAIPMTLNQITTGTTIGANDDYQSPATTACFQGDGQYPTESHGRDVVYSFTAPADGRYTFRQTYRLTGSTIYGAGQNVSLYLTDCANSGTVNCLKGSNSIYGQSSVGTLGQNSQVGEAVSCFPMTAGQTTYLVLDNGTPGRCSDNNHKCKDTSFCHPGATCVPQINAGGTFTAEVIECHEEVEPNDTPATATPLFCGSTGASGGPAATAKCYLGDRNGNSCNWTYASLGFMPQDNENSNMRCLGSGAMCIQDPATGTDDCAVGTGPCQQNAPGADDCDPRCDVGPNAGKACTTHAFCNPVSDQGATCAGACIVDNHCIDTATGTDTGIACTPTCQNSTIPSVNGRVCASAANFDACPGAGTCTTTALVPAPGATCSTGQVCGRQFNEGDTDFYSVGSPVAGSKVFASVFANDANDYDYRMRITTATNTLQFDDNDAVSVFGGTASSVIGGAVTDGSPTYVAVSRTIPRTTNTYRIYSIVRPPLAAAENEDESGPFGNNEVFYWPGDSVVANPTNTGYTKGAMNFPGDTDCFRFLVNQGDLIDAIGDGGPARGTGSVATVSNPFPIFDDIGVAIGQFVWGSELKKNTLANVQGPGLHALSPAVTSGYEQWRASYTGMMEVCYYDLRNFYQTSGPQTYPTPWAGSISSNCGPVMPAGPGTTTTEISITKTGPAGPLVTGQFYDYTWTVTNEGSQIAQNVEILDQLDVNLRFVGLDIDDGFGGDNTACDIFSLPDVLTPPPFGTPDVPIDCVNASMAPGTSTTYTLHVQVVNCVGSDIAISNTVDIVYADSNDPNPDNNSATAGPALTVAAGANGCSDVICDGDSNSCIQDLCTDGQTCGDAGECVGGGATVCNDNNVCTDDSCDSAAGCVFDSSQNGDLCDDFNGCTQNACDQILGCVYPPETAGTACDDGLSCTSTDACDGTGSCLGHSSCDDNNPCTDDFADENSDPACACTHTAAADATPCDDSNVCTQVDSCVAGICVGNGALDCNDSNACTSDSCDTATGCAHSTISCDNGNACDGVESCDTATGCVSGVPVICSASDQCHVAGTCSPGSGLCSNPAAPDGTACDDGNAGTSGDTCLAGVCTGGSACTSTNDPKSKGWYKSLCNNSHSGDSLTNADAACVGALTNTFAGISTVAQICDVLGQSTNNGASCNKADDQLMVLALNICKQRVCPSSGIDSSCGGNSSVGQSLAEADAILDNPLRSTLTCQQAECLCKEINNGHALELDSLLSMREGVNIRLNWLLPYVDDGQGAPRNYSIWRRAVGSKTPFVKIGTVTGLTYLDTTVGTGSWEYDLTPNF